MPLHIRSRPLLDSFTPIRVKRVVSISELTKIERHLCKWKIYYSVEVLTEGVLVDSPNSIIWLTYVWKALGSKNLDMACDPH